VTQEPDDSFMPGECVYLKLKMLDEQHKELQLHNVSLARFEKDNGILFLVKTDKEQKFYMLVRLVTGDDILELVTKNDSTLFKQTANTNHKSNLKSLKNKQPKKINFEKSFNTTLHTNSLCMFFFL
jgi:hypothetical protein